MLAGLHLLKYEYTASLCYHGPAFRTSSWLRRIAAQFERETKCRTSPKRVVIYSSHAIGPGSMRVHGAPVWRARASEHRSEGRRGEEETGSRSLPHRVSTECLPLHVANEQSSHSHVCQLTRCTPGFHLCKGFTSPTAGCAFFSGKPPLPPPPLSSPGGRCRGVVCVFTRYPRWRAGTAPGAGGWQELSRVLKTRSGRVVRTPSSGADGLAFRAGDVTRRLHAL